LERAGFTSLLRFIFESLEAAKAGLELPQDKPRRGLKESNRSMQDAAIFKFWSNALPRLEAKGRFLSRGRSFP
jgi:hypothetical protein